MTSAATKNFEGIEMHNSQSLESFRIVFDCLDKLQNAKLTRKEEEKVYETLIENLWVVNHAKLKLEGLSSLSTSCLINPICIKRMLDGLSICYHCYAANQQAYQKGLDDRNVINYIVLTSVVIPVKYWKKGLMFSLFNMLFFRIESFGDVSCDTQVINYCNFCRAFPHMHFAAWTKNIKIWTNVFRMYGKPSNLVFIVSSPYTNKVLVPDEEDKKFIDHVFTVWDKKTIVEQNVKINCGGKKCAACIANKKGCYFKNTEYFINEQLK